MTDAAAARWMRWSVAFVWLWTGLGVLHPYYREKGEFYLAPLGLPAWVMWITCAGEVGLAVWVALRKSATWLTALQVATILAFSVILSFSHPKLWLHPQGVLTKNLPIIGLLVAAWLLEREKSSVKAAYYVLGLVMVVFWWADCSLTRLPSLPARPLSLVLFWLYLMELVLELFLPFCMLIRLFWRTIGRSVATLTACTAVLVKIVELTTLITSWEEPVLWFHPFGPLSKNVAVVGASAMLLVLATHLDERKRKSAEQTEQTARSAEVIDDRIKTSRGPT